jgi:hypothetical protein
VLPIIGMGMIIAWEAPGSGDYHADDYGWVGGNFVMSRGEVAMSRKNANHRDYCAVERGVCAGDWGF